MREFALTMTAAVGISLIASLTVTPMLASRVLAAPGTEKDNAVFRASRRFFDGLHARYARRLDWALNHRGPVLLLLLGAVILNVFLIVVAPKGLLPQQDTGAMTGGLRVDQSMSFTATSEKLTQAANIIRADPAVATLVAFTGGGRAGGLYVRQPQTARRTPADHRCDRPPAPQAGAGARGQPVPQPGAGSAGGRAPDQRVLSICAARRKRPDAARGGGKLVKALKAQPQAITDVDIDQQDAGASAFVTVDRDRAASLGIAMNTIDQTLYDAFGQRQVASIYQGSTSITW
jgi:multidrug efflux pump